MRTVFIHGLLCISTPNPPTYHEFLYNFSHTVIFAYKFLKMSIFCVSILQKHIKKSLKKQGSSARCASSTLTMGKMCNRYTLTNCDPSCKMGIKETEKKSDKGVASKTNAAPFLYCFRRKEVGCDGYDRQKADDPRAY